MQRLIDDMSVLAGCQEPSSERGAPVFVGGSSGRSQTEMVAVGQGKRRRSREARGGDSKHLE